MKSFRFVVVIGLLWFSLLFGAVDTVRVVTYNVLKFSESVSQDRLDALQAVIRFIEPDLLCVQEMSSARGLAVFQSSVLDETYQAVPFHDGPDTDNALFFHKSKFRFIEANYLSTDLRDIAEYVLEHLPSGEILRVYSLHLKASQGTDNEQRREQEIRVLLNHLATLPTETNILIVGDFNLYSASEGAYQQIISSGYLIDPLNAAGNWHNNPSYAYLHTQSPRAEQFGGGSYGGLDDRFDFIFISDDLSDNLLANSYHSVGNDGSHFNISINVQPNTAVPSDIADALYYASDHLPVSAQFVFDVITGLREHPGVIARSPRLVNIYPNPFNPTTRIVYELPRSSEVRLELFNLLGQRMATLFSGKQSAGRHVLDFRADPQLPGGIYFLRLSNGEFQVVRKMIYVR